MTRTIEIVVKPDGSTSLETKGFAGADCRTASAFLEQSLGKHVGETLKPEFHHTAGVQLEIRQQ